MTIKESPDLEIKEKEKNLLFPVFLKLEKLHTLVIGGMYTGHEKLHALVNNCASAKITVIAKEFGTDVKTIASRHSGVILVEREFRESDLDGKDIVIVATGDKALGQLVKAAANAKGILTNVADTPELCDFYLSSVVQKGNIKIAISTNGKSPTVAKRVKEVLDDAFPEEVNELLENLTVIRGRLKGDFTEKVRKLNGITSSLVESEPKPKLKKWQLIFMIVLSCIGLMIAGHLILSFVPYQTLGGIAKDVILSVDASILIYILGGFIAQMIDGALGMAYGVSATTFLMSFGISPAAASASVHASEIFTSGVSGLMHLKFKNVNSKLFKTLLLPGVVGAILGAYILSSLSEYSYIMKPIVATYTLILGVLIIKKVINQKKQKPKVKNIAPLALFGGFFDAVGGGGWGPIVSSTLIADGRNPRYTIGSVNLTEFFVALSASLTFTIFMGINHWQVIIGLLIGGVIAAPIAANIARKIPIKTMMILVGIIVIIVSLRNIYTTVF